MWMPVRGRICFLLRRQYLFSLHRTGSIGDGGIPMFKGTVKWFNNQKGYGFIQDEDGKDIFVHYTGLDMEGFRSLDEGNKVEFDIVEGEKGLQASHVVKVQN